MTEYFPDRWLLLEVIDKNNIKFLKVLSSTNGGYLGSDTWRLNSGIVKAIYFKEKDVYRIYSESGSCYNCCLYGATNLGYSIFEQLKEKFPNRIKAAMSEKEAVELMKQYGVLEYE